MPLEIASVVRRLAERAVQAAKRDPGYRVDPGIGTRSILIELRTRAGSLLRAQWVLRGVGGGPLRFVEPGVTIQHRHLLSVGSGTVIERGVLLRCLSERGFVIGSHVTLGRHSIIEATGVLWQLAPGFEIGDRSSVGDWSFVGCGGGVWIGKDVIVGQRLSVHSQNHNFDDGGEAIRSQGVSGAGVRIEDNCWIGANVTILDGVTIRSGTVVAAGSIVTKSCGPDAIVAGNPARLIRNRLGDGGATAHEPANRD